MFLFKSVETSDLFSVGSQLGPAGPSGSQLECRAVHLQKWACVKLLVHGLKQHGCYSVMLTESIQVLAKLLRLAS